MLIKNAYIINADQSGQVDILIKKENYTSLIKIKKSKKNLEFKIYHLKFSAPFTFDISQQVIHFPLFFIYILLFTFLLFTGETMSQETDTTVYKTPVIEVEALKGIEKVVPINLEIIKRESIEKRYWMQDLPMFLNGSTNINAYSESGASVGYSYLTIRGFDQRRISVLLNGTPQNDALEHQVYWVELSDITSSVENIQIQRSVSTALFGTSGIGGVINLQTVDFFKNKFLNLNAGYGAYNSKRFSLEYSSGLTKSGFGFYGKFSKTNTDGYRNLSWSDHWSYFLSGGKLFGQNSVIKLNIYGSPIKNHLAYYGITKDYLDGKVTGDESNDRRYNPLEYPDEKDNFFQPHFELIYNLQAAKDLFISNTFNYVRRDGYYINNYPVSRGYDYSHFRIPTFYAADTFSYNINYYLRNSYGHLVYLTGKGYPIVRSDLATKLKINGNDFGWYPKILLKHTGDIGNLLIGGEFRLHNSEHSGEIVSATTLPPGIPENYKYYSYNGKKSTFSVYLNEFTNIEKKLSGMIGIQLTYHKYKIDDIAYTPYNFNVDYKFLTSRIGMNYNFNNYFRAFMNVSIARREPGLSDIYDGSNVTAKPNFAVVDTINGIYSEPLITYEEMKDYELGFGYAGDLMKANLNLYWMDYTNEIVSNGQLDNFGQPLTWNAGKSVHRGIELEFEYNLLAKNHNGVTYKNPFLTLSGNLSLSDNYFEKYLEKKLIDSLGNIYGSDYSGNQILLNPQIIGNLSLNFNSDYGINAYLTVQYIGKQYLDNSQNEEKNPEAKLVPGYVNKVINPYTVFNAGVSLDLIPILKSDKLNKFFKSLETSLKINNILNNFYEATGGINNAGAPIWIPAAERNIFFNLKVGF
ncbi:MAG TPA: TonB-dependent receptor [Ignavibacteria bacterium]